MTTLFTQLAAQAQGMSALIKPTFNQPLSVDNRLPAHTIALHSLPQGENHGEWLTQPAQQTSPLANHQPDFTSHTPPTLPNENYFNKQNSIGLLPEEHSMLLASTPKDREPLSFSKKAIATTTVEEQSVLHERNAHDNHENAQNLPTIERRGGFPERLAIKSASQPLKAITEKSSQQKQNTTLANLTLPKADQQAFMPRLPSRQVIADNLNQENSLETTLGKKPNESISSQAPATSRQREPYEKSTIKSTIKKSYQPKQNAAPINLSLIDSISTHVTAEEPYQPKQNAALLNSSSLDSIPAHAKNYSNEKSRTWLEKQLFTTQVEAILADTPSDNKPPKKFTEHPIQSLASVHVEPPAKKNRIDQLDATQTNSTTRISIGRIKVRTKATKPKATSARGHSSQARATNRTSLIDYLKKHSGD